MNLIKILLAIVILISISMFLYSFYKLKELRKINKEILKILKEQKTVWNITKKSNKEG